jgi:Undecaprenyl-phosphate glucose phosphotransferase
MLGARFTGQTGRQIAGSNTLPLVAAHHRDTAGRIKTKAMELFGPAALILPSSNHLRHCRKPVLIACSEGHFRVSLNFNTTHKGAVDGARSDGAGQGADPAKRRFSLPFHLLEPLVLLTDLALVLTFSVLAGTGYHWFFLGVVTGDEKFVAIGLLAFVNVSSILAARGDYRVSNLGNFYRQARDLTLIWTGVLLVLLAVAFSLKVEEDFSRGATFTFFALGLFGMIAWRRLVAKALRHALATGAFFAPRNVILIGERRLVAASPSVLEVQRYGYTPIQTFEIGEEDLILNKMSPRLRATVNKAIEAARAEAVVEILLLIGWEHTRTIDAITEAMGVLPIPIYLAPDENIARYVGGPRFDVGDVWLAEVKRAPLTRNEQFAKRCFDIIGAGSALLLLSPLMFFTALLIKLDSQGPILFFQTRNGFNGRPFRIAKFRTMRVLEDGNVIRQVTRSDPRVTRLGRWLRRTNIDELPQLFNVLDGSMSLVGPRPHAVAHNSEFEKLIANYAFRNHVKPGITGWAQVNGYRGETPSTDLMEKRVELDLWYISNWNILLDMKILLKTLFLGVQPTAY